MTPSQRKALEDAAAREGPLCRAIAAALRRIDDLQWAGETLAVELRDRGEGKDFHRAIAIIRKG